MIRPGDQSVPQQRPLYWPRARRMTMIPEIPTRKGTASDRSDWQASSPNRAVTPAGTRITAAGLAGRAARWVVVAVMICAAVIRVPGSCQGADLALLTAQELEPDLKAWVILDARPEKDWKRGCIPGSFPFSWERYTHVDEDGVPYRIMSPQSLGAALGRLGIAPESPVLVYGDADESWGGEGWVCWVLQWLGHAGPVRLLAGGIRAWEESGFSLAPGSDVEALHPASYVPRPKDGMLVSARDLHDSPGRYQLVDTRSTLEWFRGHLPGAVHIAWADFYKGRNRTALDSSQLRQLLSDNGIATDRPVVYYCTGGIRSGYAWLVHELSGLPAALNFEGGTAEWDLRYP